jgi:hypothetical protein
MSERIRNLEQLGFQWARPKRVTWDEQFRELQQFASVEGHCGVPHTWSHNSALGSWVAHQQRSHKAMKEGCRSHGAGWMNAACVAKLESIGFEWSFGGSDSCGTVPMQVPQTVVDASERRCMQHVATSSGKQRGSWLRKVG